MQNVTLQMEELYISSEAGPSLQAQEPRLQFCRRQVFHHKLRNEGCSFTRDWIGAVASRCFPHLTLSLASEQTLKDMKRSQGHKRGGEEDGFGYLGPPDFIERERKREREDKILIHNKPRTETTMYIDIFIDSNI